MLEFMYTGSTDLVDQCPEEILAIADKYAILPLKEQCEKRLARTISAKNVSTTAMFADTYSAPVLKAACTRFLSHHHKDVLRSAEWKQLKRERSELANELLESVLAGGDVAPADYSMGGASDEAGPSTSSTIKTEPPSTSSSSATRPPPRKRVRRTARST